MSVMNTRQLCDKDNASLRSGNSTSDLWLVEDGVTGQVTAAFLLLILVVGLPWNLLVVLTIVKEKLYHQPTIVLLLNLVFNDIILLIFSVPAQIVTGFAGEYIFGKTDDMRCSSCQLGVLEVTFSIMSIYIISVMAFDRFLYIYRPLRYEKIVTSSRVTVLLVVIWIVLFLCSVLPLIGLEIVFNSAYLSCTLDFSKGNFHYFVILIALSLLPILALLVFNVWVVVIVQRNIRAVYGVKYALDANEQSAMRKKGQEKEFHMIKVFTVLLGSNLLEWLPTIVLVIYLMSVQVQPGEGPTKLISAFHVLFVSQIALHPIIESFLIKDVREPLKRLILCKFCLRQRNNAAFSEKDWLCDNSCLQHYGQCMDKLQAAVLRNSHCHLKQQQEKIDALKARA